jgi:hypothetical protein
MDDRLGIMSSGKRSIWRLYRLHSVYHRLSEVPGIVAQSQASGKKCVLA